MHQTVRKVMIQKTFFLFKEIRAMTIKENAETLIVGSKEIGLELNADKPKYMVMS
jgi:hypothetical protein